VKTNRQLSASVLVLSAFLALMLASAAPGQETDGDTIKVLLADQQLLRVRLAFCDAPEKRQAFGARAKRR
jgi:endonuclease YncB( thermonuclease family)